MELNILGKNTDDKGTQLETLTTAILKKLGFQNIVTNEISNGGHEIDVRAEIEIPGVAKNRRTLICECKATKDPISTSDWLKFLGKVYVEDDGNIDACMIALSGANGNVTGNYRKIREKRGNVQLVWGRDLIDHMKEIYNLKDISIVHQNLKKFSDREYTGITLCYYNRKVFYLVTLSENEYTLFSSNGEKISQSEAIPLMSLIKENDSAYENYVDLEHEKNALNRIRFAEIFIVSFFSLKPSEIEKSELSALFEQVGNPIPGITETEIDKALQLLENTGLVRIVENKLFLSIRSGNPDISEVIGFYKFILGPNIPEYLLGSDLYNEFINEELLEAVLKIQGGISIPSEKTAEIITILKWSPSALLRVLSPISMIVNHRNPEAIIDDRTDVADRDYFLQLITDSLSKDFVQSDFKSFFHDKCKIVELEEHHRLIIKSKEKTEQVHELQQRLLIAPTTEELGGGLILVRILPGVGEPWDLYKTKTTTDE